jgi:C4-dicarboxylate transporter DctM subunit
LVLLVVVLLVLFVASVPIAMSLGMAAIPTLVDRGIPFIAIPQVIFEALDSFALMALPLYILAGRLMQHGGIAGRLVDFAKALVSWVRGGLAAAVVMTSMLFATISGSSAATAAAIGSMLIPEMEKQKYPRPFSAAVTASSGELGVIIPPSVAMVIYGVITGVSITDLFIAGFSAGPDDRCLADDNGHPNRLDHGLWRAPAFQPWALGARRRPCPLACLALALHAGDHSGRHFRWHLHSH